MSPLQRRAVTFWTSLLAVSACLTGCAATSADIGAPLSARLQSDVAEVAQLAAAHRYPEAATALATLRRTARSSVASGAVSPERATRIDVAVDLVAADLKAAQQATKSPAPATTPTPLASRASAATAETPATAGTRKQQHDRARKWLEHWKKRAEEAKHSDEETQKQPDDGDD